MIELSNIQIYIKIMIILHLHKIYQLFLVKFLNTILHYFIILKNNIIIQSYRNMQ